MGSRGPAPKPTALKQLQGNPGKRALPKGEPRPAVRLPSAPRWLGKEAKREWRRLAKGLVELGMLTELDAVALGMLCESLVQYREAAEVVAEEGMLARSDKGNLYQHPAVGIMNSVRSDVLRWAREFGMTPSARSRIVVDAPGEEPSLADLLFEAVGQ
jgi:P27 family predicted phage terminase small subunit